MSTIYPTNTLPSAIILYTERNQGVLIDLFNYMLDETLTSQQAKEAFEDIIKSDPRAAFQQQCDAYAMQRGASLPEDRASMAQLWKHPDIDSMCCRVAIYIEPDGSLEIHAKKEKRADFAVFYQGDEENGKQPAMALCLKEDDGIINLSDAGDESVFSGFLGYNMEAASGLFAEAENHARGSCSCSPTRPGEALGQPASGHTHG